MFNILQKINIGILIAAFSISFVNNLIACENNTATGSLYDHPPSYKRPRDNMVTQHSLPERLKASPKRMKKNADLSIFPEGVASLLVMNEKESNKYKIENFQLEECSAVRLLTTDEKKQDEIKAILSGAPINNVHFLDITEEEKISFNGLFKPYHSQYVWSEANRDILHKAFETINASTNADIFSQGLKYLASLGHPGAQYKHGWSEPDKEKRKLLFHLSASQGYVPAFLKLYEIYEEDGQDDLAALFLKVAALKGNREARQKFISLYMKDSSDIENEIFLAVLSVFCAIGDKDALSFRKQIRECPEKFGEY